MSAHCHSSAPTECLGNTLYWVQQLLLQLGFLKRCEQHLPGSGPATKQAKLPWESDICRAFPLSPLLFLHVTKEVRAAHAHFANYSAHSGAYIQIQS
jgi:hypothetical protein